MKCSRRPARSAIRLPMASKTRPEALPEELESEGPDSACSAGFSGRILACVVPEASVWRGKRTACCCGFERRSAARGADQLTLVSGCRDWTSSVARRIAQGDRPDVAQSHLRQVGSDGCATRPVRTLADAFRGPHPAGPRRRGDDLGGLEDRREAVGGPGQLAVRTDCLKLNALMGPLPCWQRWVRRGFAAFSVRGSAIGQRCWPGPSVPEVILSRRPQWVDPGDAGAH